MYKQELEQILTQAYQKAGYDDTARVIISNRKDLCDYQSDDSFQLAKKYHQSPMTIASLIQQELQKMPLDDIFTKIEVANPGFINLTLSDTFINRYMQEMMDKPKFNLTPPEKDELFYVDYGGANIAKPLHVGHLRPAIIGESINRILRFAGYRTISDAHLGDFGLQIGEVIYAILRDFKEVPLEKIQFDIKYLDRVYPEMSKKCKEDEDLLKECQQITKDLQDGNPTYQVLWKQIVNVSLQDVKRLYHYLDVDFDFWYGESECFPIIPEMKSYLEKQGIVEVSEGAKIINVKEASDQKEVPPFILEKSNGASLYSTTDLACIYERMKRFSPDHILYVVDLRQGLHFEQVFRAAKKSHMVPYTTLEHIGFGTINGQDGKPFKTRSGESLKLDDLILQVKETFLNLKEENKNMAQEDIDKIVNAIIKFADLQNNREKNYIFDIQKFSNVVGKTGPYILYTYLRIQKIIGTGTKELHLSNQIYNRFDRDLRLKLLELEQAIQNAVKDRMPHYIADYVYQLCVLANNFYQNNYLTNLAEEQKKNDWILILTLTNNIIQTLLDLLVIEIPSIM